MQGTSFESVPLRAGPSHGPVDCPVRWQRSARARKVSLRIDPRAGEVVVTLPPRAGRRQGMALLAAHAAWVTERLGALAPAVPFADGAAVPLGGVPHVVRHAPALRAGVLLRDGEILVSGEAGFLSRRLVDFLRDEARRRIALLAAPHAAALGVRPRVVRLKDTRTRWGSCAPDGTVAFSWRLVMAPEWVLDYVVAHELCHLRELNHSPRFWAHVASRTPHRVAAQDWLRCHGPGLLRVG